MYIIICGYHVKPSLKKLSICNVEGVKLNRNTKNIIYLQRPLICIVSFHEETINPHCNYFSVAQEHLLL